MKRLQRRRPICMIVHAYYEEDPRVRREAECLVAAGWAVDVFGLRRPGESPSAVVAGVNLRRLPVGRHQGAGLPVYLAEYGAFLARAFWAAALAHRRRRYGLVEVHSLPDYLVFAALPLKLVGVPVLLDLHEAMPEFFRSRFPGRREPDQLSLAAAPGEAFDRPGRRAADGERAAGRTFARPGRPGRPADRHPQQPGSAAFRSRAVPAP